MGLLNYPRNSELFPRNLEGRARAKDPENKKIKKQRAALIKEIPKRERKMEKVIENRTSINNIGKKGGRFYGCL